MMYSSNREAYEAALERATKAMRAAVFAAGQFSSDAEQCDCDQVLFAIRELASASVMGRRARTAAAKGQMDIIEELARARLEGSR